MTIRFSLFFSLLLLLAAAAPPLRHLPPAPRAGAAFAARSAEAKTHLWARALPFHPSALA
jgi:hypothetical protein